MRDDPGARQELFVPRPEVAVSDRRTFVIVGGGLAGGKAVEALRAEGFDDRLVLVSAEAELPAAERVPAAPAPERPRKARQRERNVA